MKENVMASKAQSALTALLQKDPPIAAPLAALTKAVDRFEAIRSKLHDASVEQDARQREADARKNLVRLQALTEIGEATAEQVQGARKELETARDALESVSGRREVLTSELLKAQHEVAAAEDPLKSALEPWKADVREAAVNLAEEGLRLVMLAVSASQATGASYPGRPRYIMDLPSVFDQFGINAMPAITDFPKSEVVGTSLAVARRAERASSEIIEIPKPAPDRAPPIAPTYSAPGIPHGLTHDPLGNPLPEAKAALERERARRAAPYDDGRSGATEVQR
jgi:hypothetical protein